MIIFSEIRDFEMSCELTSDSQNTKIKIPEAIFMFVLHNYGHAKQENIKEKTLF